MFSFAQLSLESLLSIFSLAIHLSMLENYVLIVLDLFFSYLMMCFSKNLTRPLSGVLIKECHQSF